MRETWDVLVVGGGPAGLMAAIAAAEAGASTLLLEKKAGPGHKLLVSGSGRCNFTHSGPLADFLGHYAGAGRFLRTALYAFDNRASMDFFAARGVPSVTEEGGKVFPASDRAGDLLKVLVGEFRAKGGELRTGAAVMALERGEGGGLAATWLGPGGPEVEALARAVVLATGGASWPVTGSSGDGYALAHRLGHRIVEVGPALTPVVVTAFPVADLAGLSLRDRPLTVWRDGAKAATGRGDLLFTHKGLSGPGILDLSRSIRPRDEVGIGLLPGLTTADLEEALLKGARDHGKRLVRSLLAEGRAGRDLPQRLTDLLADRITGDPEARAATLSREARKALAAALGDLRLPVAALGGWDEAMATRGGVALDEVDPRRMESRIAPGLFLAGEVLDVDGDTGGYNIHAALATGRLAGLSAAAAALRA